MVGQHLTLPANVLQNRHVPTGTSNGFRDVWSVAGKATDQTTNMLKPALCIRITTDYLVYDSWFAREKENINLMEHHNIGLIVVQMPSEPKVRIVFWGERCDSKRWLAVVNTQLNITPCEFVASTQSDGLSKSFSNKQHNI